VSRSSSRPATAVGCAVALALALSACGTASSTSTSAFSGVKREVAQTIANFQSDSSGAEEKKICGDDLATALVTRLGGAKACEKAFKKQLAQVDNPELTIESVRLAPHGASASATVKSIHEGKSRASSLSLVKERGKWRISGQ
jgi:hypothetical protein